MPRLVVLGHFCCECVSISYTILIEFRSVGMLFGHLAVGRGDARRDALQGADLGQGLLELLGVARGQVMGLLQLDHRGVELAQDPPLGQVGGPADQRRG